MVRPTSPEDLRTVDGTVYATYAEAARTLGLATDDAYWRECLAEAATEATPVQLRDLFVLILTREPPDTPQNPGELWDDF